MAFPIIEGFDRYNGTGSQVGIQAVWQNVGSGSFSMGTGRFGGQCLNMADGTGNTSFIRRAYTTPHSDFSIGFAFKDASGSAFSNQSVFRIESATGTQMSLYLESGTQIWRVYRGLGTTQLIASGPIWQPVVWSYVQLIGKIDQTVGWVEFYVDGNIIGRFDGDTAALAGTTMDGVLFSAPDRTGSGSTVQFDDFYVADNNTNYGQCRIETLAPTSDTAQKNFTPSTAGTNFDDVDDATFNTTDYVESSTVNHLDLYNLADLSSTPATIHAVRAFYAAQKTDAGNRRSAIVIRSNVTDNTSADASLSNDPFIYAAQTLLVDPQDSAPWNAAKVNALLMGPKVSV